MENLLWPLIGGRNSGRLDNVPSYAKVEAIKELIGKRNSENKQLEIKIKTFGGSSLASRQ